MSRLALALGLASFAVALWGWLVEGHVGGRIVAIGWVAVVLVVAIRKARKP